MDATRQIPRLWITCSLNCIESILSPFTSVICNSRKQLQIMASLSRSIQRVPSLGNCSVIRRYINSVNWDNFTSTSVVLTGRY